MGAGARRFCRHLLLLVFLRLLLAAVELLLQRCDPPDSVLGFGGNNFPSLAAPVASGQLRDGRGRESPAVHSLQSLSAPLPGAETGSRQRCILWETHPLHLHGTPHAAPGDEVTAFPPPSAPLPVFQRPDDSLLLQRELQVPLLRYPGEARLPAQQAPGGHAVHGAPAAARPAEAEVRRRRPRRRRPPPAPPPR